MRWMPVVVVGGLVGAGQAIAQDGGAEDARDANGGGESWFAAHFTNRIDPGPLETDRPDFTEGPTPVAKGWTQLESGYTFVHDDEDGTDVQDHTFPELLVRHGLATNFEVRLGWEGFSSTRTETGGAVDHEDGFTDMSVGFKSRLWRQEGALPDFSVIGELAIPVGSDAKTSDHVEPAVKLIWSYELTEAIGLSGNVNFAGPYGEEGRFFQFETSVALGLGLGERWGTYVEYFGLFPAEQEPTQHFVNGGVTFLVTENLQLDARVGAGLNESADDFFAGAGLSWRF